MPTPYRWIPLLSPTYRAVRRFVFQYLYVGKQVACPLCERSFRGWLFDPRHGVCPYCRSSARHRLLGLYLTEEWKGRWGTLELLHFGPEWCLERHFHRDSRLRNYVTADLAAPEADVHTDITSMKFANESFDAIICCHVLEHIPADRAAMQELFRVLRPRGVAYIQVPFNSELPQTDEDPSVIDPKERERRFGQFDHCRVYGRDVGNRLREAGFEVTEVRAIDILDTEQMTRYGLWNDVVFRCKRRDGTVPA